ncbi:MAG: FHA domain-containing protein [Planctomycetota bacterium]
MLKLRLLTGPRAGRQMRISDTKPVSIGRRKGRLRLQDSRVSKNHAEIYFENDLWLLKDLGSANGTFVNRQKVDGLTELEPGDLVQMGRVLIKVVRCDGIGMDTAPELPDELLSDDALGIGALDTEPIEANGELDLASMFEDGRSPDPLEDSDELPALSEPAATAVEETADTLRPDFDQPADEEDSFFADLGMADPPAENADLPETGAEIETIEDDTVGESVSESADPFGLDGGASVESVLSPEEVGAPDEKDPFLAGGEADSEDTSDQISLDDESGMGSHSAGTTLLTSVSHEDLTREEDEEEAEVEPPVADEDQSDDADEEAPALVGLHLDHAPPQQPEVAEDEDLSTEAELEVTDAQAGDEELAVDEPVVDEPVLGVQEEPLEAIAELESEPEIEATEEAVEDELDQAIIAEVEAQDGVTEYREAETVDQEPVEETVSDFENEPDPLEVLANEVSGDEPAASIAEADDATNSDGSEDDTEPGFDITEPIDLDEEIEDLITPGVEDPPSEMEGGVADTPVPDHAAVDEVPDAAAGTDTTPVFDAEAEVEVEAGPALGHEAEEEAGVTAGTADKFDDDAPDFDIDAAFDALSEGLDDSVESPTIGTELDEQAPEVVAEQSDDAAEATDPLVGSQLDVGFIKDALSKLEEQDQAEAEPPTEDTQPKASAAPPTKMPPPSTADQYLQSPPPGLNPSSLNPPEEPSRSYAPYNYRSNTGRWFFILLLMLGVGGVGGWLISQNYDKWIAGRDGASAVTPENPAPTGVNAPAPVKPDSKPASEEAWPLTQEQPLADQNRSDASSPPQTAGPDPFGAGPGLLGSDAVKGLTRGSDDDRPLDQPQPPSSVNRTTPDPIRQPNPAPGGSDRTTANPSIDNTPTLQPSTENNPAVAEQPSARIVFLVDASGSLIDSLPQMLVWLNRALQTVEEDERFAIYFFKAGEPIAIKPEGMLVPSREVLNQISKDWLDPNSVPVFPSGRSNPSNAITAALKLEPTDIYLLSDDAFAAHQGDTSPDQALDLVKQALGDSDARVHGVQFFYRSDNSILKTLADQTKGTFEFVRDRVSPDADPIDLLEELGE